MKVLFVGCVNDSGSTGRIVMSLLDTVKSHGDEGLFCYSRGSVPAGRENDCKMFGGKAEIAFHGAITRLFDAQGSGSHKATGDLIKTIKDYDPDIIHLHNVHGYYLNIEKFFGFLKDYGKPVVWTLHDCWNFTGHCAYFDYAECGQWKTGCKNCKNKDSYPKSVGLCRAAKNYEKKKRLFTQVPDLTLVTPSKWLKNVVAESFLKDVPCINIANGIDLEKFYPKESDIRVKYGLEGVKFALAAAGYWTAQKGYGDLADLGDELAEFGWKLAVIGVNEKQQKELSAHGIIALPRTSNLDELADWYSAADVFVNPTYEDNFPTVNIEALACGTPVVTYMTGGSPEIVEKGCGGVTPKGFVNMLALAATQTVKNTELCRKTAEKYSSKDKFEEYYELYKNILNKMQR